MRGVAGENRTLYYRLCRPDPRQSGSATTSIDLVRPARFELAPPDWKSGMLPTTLRTRGGARGGRTLDLLLARQALSRLSYGPGDGPPGKNRTSVSRLSVECPGRWTTGGLGWPNGLEPSCTRITTWALDHFGIDQQTDLVPPTGVEPVPPGLQPGALPAELQWRWRHEAHQSHVRESLCPKRMRGTPISCEARSATYENRTRLDRSTTGSHPRCATWQWHAVKESNPPRSDLESNLRPAPDVVETWLQGRESNPRSSA